jgi:hypothetical protein
MDDLRDEVRSYARRRRRVIMGVVIGRQSSGRLIFGLIAITLGVLWTLDNLGFVDSSEFLRWWPTVVIAIGLAKLFGIGTRQHRIWGATFSVAGALLLTGSLGLSRVTVGTLWPVLMIVLGIQLLSRGLQARSPFAVSDGPGGDPTASVNTFAFWSGIDRKPSSQAFRGGDVSAVMGGVRMDLRGAKPVPEGAVLDLFVWWGGVDLRIPETMRVVNETNVVMGGIEDKTKTPPADARDVLILRGLVIMGGVELKG